MGENTVWLYRNRDNVLDTMSTCGLLLFQLYHDVNKLAFNELTMRTALYVYKICMCWFSAKHAALKRKSKDWLAWNQNIFSEWSDISSRGLLFQ
jgi:hypothetical protein